MILRKITQHKNYKRQGGDMINAKISCEFPEEIYGRKYHWYHVCWIKAMRIMCSLVSFQFIYNIIYKKIEGKKFEFKDVMLPYYFHSHNNYGLTERAVELPIFEHYLKTLKCERILEIGNVTNHYYTLFKDSVRDKTVIDKFEKGAGVINLDIKNYYSDKKYDVIISISTFEHMDSDLGKNKDYVAGCSKLTSVAADNILHVRNSLLNEGGIFILSAPVGYTPEWDATLRNNDFIHCGFSRVNLYYYMKTGDMQWRVSNLDECLGQALTSYRPYRKCMVVLELVK